MDICLLNHTTVGSLCSIWESVARVPVVGRLCDLMGYYSPERIKNYVFASPHELRVILDSRVAYEVVASSGLTDTESYDVASPYEIILQPGLKFETNEAGRITGLVVNIYGCARDLNGENFRFVAKDVCVVERISVDDITMRLAELLSGEMLNAEEACKKLMRGVNKDIDTLREKLPEPEIGSFEARSIGTAIKHAQPGAAILGMGRLCSVLEQMGLRGFVSSQSAPLDNCKPPSLSGD